MLNMVPKKNKRLFNNLKLTRFKVPVSKIGMLFPKIRILAVNFQWYSKSKIS